jgi:RNA polymerase sigma-70 factor (TIGR02943 family)
MNSATDTSAASLDDPVFLQDLRRQMLRFATLQLSDTHLAEDAVQEALIGALKNANRFGGRAALKTWVFAILKNKIADVLRQRQRLREADHVLHTDEEGEDLRELFDARGFWQADEHPVAWNEPQQAVLSAHFWRVFEACLDRLPNQQARVFMMREFLELETPEICDAIGITVSNLNVMLHRARLRLRECLEKNWFAPGETLC